MRAVFSRRLKQLEQAGLVRLDRGQVQVLAAARLGRLAGALSDSSR